MKKHTILFPSSWFSWGFLTILLVLFLWYAITAIGLVRPIFLPSPEATSEALWNLLVSGRFFRALIISFLRIAGATVLATIFGAVVGVMMGISKKIESALSPLTQSIRYLPITALIPLLVLWFGIGETMKVVFLFIGIAFYFIPLVANAVRTVPEDYINVARSFGARWLAIARHIYWPQALPQIFDGLIVVNAIGWTYIILAEIVNAREGLGYLINIAGRLQRSDEVFAGLILIAAVAMSSDRILRRIKNKYFNW